MNNESSLEKILFSLSRPRLKEYVQKMQDYKEDDKNDLIFNLLRYTSFEGDYFVKFLKNRLELEKFIVKRDIYRREEQIINAKFIFPEKYSDLINSLDSSNKIQERRIIIYPKLEKNSFRNLFSNTTWDESEAMEGKIIYQKKGIFRKEKFILEGVTLGEDKYLLEQRAI